MPLYENNPPPSRKSVDTYGLFGIIAMTFVFIGLVIAFIAVVIWQGLVFLYNRFTKGES